MALEQLPIERVLSGTEVLAKRLGCSDELACPLWPAGGRADQRHAFQAFCHAPLLPELAGLIQAVPEQFHRMRLVAANQGAYREIAGRPGFEQFVAVRAVATYRVVDEPFAAPSELEHAKTASA
jgi:hypothetical protein